jgi:hypothetical protein
MTAARRGKPAAIVGNWRKDEFGGFRGWVSARMKKTGFLGLLFLLAPAALGQNLDNPPVQITRFEIREQGEEVRIELTTNVPLSSPAKIRASADRLVFDLPGALYTAAARQKQVNHLGIRAIRIWLQSANPPLTRIIVELQAEERYDISNESGLLVLHLSPLHQSVPPAPPASEESARVSGNPATPAARGSASTNAAAALAGIYHRGPRKPEVWRKKNDPPNLPIPPERSAASSPQPQVPVTPPADPPVPAAPLTSDSVNAEAARADATKGEKAAPSPKREEKVSTPVPPNPSGASATEGSAVPAAPAAANSNPLNGQTPALAPEPQPGGDPDPQPEMRALLATANTEIRTVFRVKFVEQDTAYLDGGRSSGLAEGMKLVVKEKPGAVNSSANSTAESAVAELIVVGVAETSAVTEIRSPKRDVVSGDLAYLSAQDLQALVQQHAVGGTRKYPAVISFTEGGDALDEEARAEVPRPPLPSVNRARGRIGVDYMGTKSLDASQASSSDIGVVVRADFTRIAGSYWNLGGYWRGRIDSRSTTSQPTLQDLINRTYHLALTYDNPSSRVVAGFGRLYLPWASSLDTIDGGYFGTRIHRGVIAGVFAGSTPDPTSWDFNPDRHIGGTFLNFESGSFDSARLSTTAGVGVSLLKWQMDRSFVFLDNSISYKRTFAVYDSLQVDRPSGTPAAPPPGTGIGRSFLTARWTPVSRLQLDFNHTYFREVPQFDPTLVGTGLLDKYLFQGFSGGGRLELVKQIFVYTELGRSNRTGDTKNSLNEMFGLTLGKVPWIGIRADGRYSRFNSSFGDGTYRALSVSRSFNEGFQLNVLAGDQAFTSALAGNQSARFVNANLDTSLGAFLFLQGGFTVYRGQLQNYNQWLFTLGYRFDSRRVHK